MAKAMTNWGCKTDAKNKDWGIEAEDSAKNLKLVYRPKIRSKD